VRGNLIEEGEIEKIFDINGGSIRWLGKGGIELPQIISLDMNSENCNNCTNITN
jgi:hypothetical protein